jgi:hypothetical protein
MYSFLMPGPGTVDKNPISHTVHNSVKEEARIKGEDEYEFFTFKAKEPVEIEFRGKPVTISKGTKFGVRPSSNGKNIRLIFPNDKTRVMTLSPEQAQKLAKGV